MVMSHESLPPGSPKPEYKRSPQTLELSSETLRMIAADRIEKNEADEVRPLIQRFVTSYYNIATTDEDGVPWVTQWEYIDQEDIHGRRYSLHIKLDISQPRVRQFMGLLGAWVTGSRHFVELDEKPRRPKRPGLR